MKNTLAKTLNRRNRDERGAGGLLPIITIGMIVVVVAAFIATSTSFAAKISTTQVKQMSAQIEETSLLNSFVQSVLSTSSITPEFTSDGTGSYKLYYSTADTAPSTITSPESIELTDTGLPGGTKWILVELSPVNGSKSTAVYSYSPKDSNQFDEVVNWTGPSNLNGATLGSATGVQGPVSLSLRGTSSDPDGALSIEGSTVSADVYADYENKAVVLKGGTIHGIISSFSEIQLVELPRILGNVYSESAINGTGDIAGIQKANELNRPTLVEHTANSIDSFGQQITLQAADCSTSERLKSKLEAIDRKSILTGAESCAPESWSTEIKPKADILVESNSNLAITKLKVTGSAGTLGFAAKDNLKLEDVSYEAGAAGQFLSAGNLSISGSKLTGAISSYGSTHGSLDIANSTVLYMPVEAPLVGNCGTSSCALSSNSIHLIRVS